MPEPSEPSQGRPERASSGTPAPGALRRRVLARVHAEPEPVGAMSMHRARRLFDTRRRAAALAIALCAATSLAIVLAISGLGNDRPRPRHSPPPGSARASLMRTGERGELHLSGMPQPPIGEVYEIWLAGAGGAPKPTDALFTPTSEGTAAVEVPGGLRGIRAITVTAEPRGGSSHPTSPVVLRVALSRAGP